MKQYSHLANALHEFYSNFFFMQFIMAAFFLFSCLKYLYYKNTFETRERKKYESSFAFKQYVNHQKQK